MDSADPHSQTRGAFYGFPKLKRSKSDFVGIVNCLESNCVTDSTFPKIEKFASWFDKFLPSVQSAFSQDTLQIRCIAWEIIPIVMSTYRRFIKVCGNWDVVKRQHGQWRIIYASIMIQNNRQWNKNTCMRWHSEKSGKKRDWFFFKNSLKIWGLIIGQGILRGHIKATKLCHQPKFSATNPRNLISL